MRQRLLVSTLALVLAALLAFALPLAWSVRGLLQGRALDGLQGTAETIGLFLDTSRTCSELQLRMLQVADPRIAVSVVTTSGQLVATTAATGRPVVGQELVDASAGRPGRHADDERVAVAARLATSVCGPALLHTSIGAAPLRAQVHRAWLLIAGVAGLVAATTAGVAWLLGRRLAQPFERLATSAGRLGEGDFSVRAPRSGLPEADRIADALDGTAVRLGRSVDRAGAFAADASHQLRTPLTALRLHLETLAAASGASADGAHGPDAAHVDAALEEADRLEATIEELVALTRPDAAAEELDLAAFVRERLPGFEDLAVERGRAVALEALPVPTVRARAGAVGQALQVLLDNALQHGSGTITVRLAPALPDEPGVAVRLCVLDEGPAVTPSDEPWVREASGRTGGRGLPLARSLVAAEGGELTVRIEPGGSTACLVLPGRRSEA